jgi:diguanylate cyclase (GGDEF)-like protein/PAS domain S-box-containing protein
MSQSLKMRRTPLSHVENNIPLSTSPSISPIFFHQQQEILLRQWLNSLIHPCCILQGQQYFYNSAFCEFSGIDLNQLEHKTWQCLIHPEDQIEFQNKVINSQKQHTQNSFELRLRHHSGNYHVCQIQINAAPLTNYDCIVSMFDLNAHYLQQQELIADLSAQSSMLDGSIDCIKLVSTEGQLKHINRSGRMALGIGFNEKKLGMPWLNLLPESVRAVGTEALQQAAKGQPAHFYGMSVLNEQPPQYWDNLLTPIFNEHGTTQDILCISREITQLREIENHLQYVLEIDELTGLFNRRAYNKNFKDILQHAEQHQEQIGLLIIDLDYFKHVNDTFGHIAGDHLLQVLGERFKTAFPEKVLVARLGGDEFSVIVPQLADEAELLEIAQICSQQLDSSISYSGQPINGGMSIGCSLYPRDAQNTSNLLKCADIALNDLKNSGRGGIQIFNEKMLKVLEETTQQLALARYILKHDLIVPFYQPKVRLSDGKVIGFEALLRWKNDEGQLMPPSFIYASFQDYDLATRISEAMQLKIFSDMSHWLAKGHQLLPISINAAPVEFLRDNYAEGFLGRLSCFDIPYNQVEVEITEQSLAERGSDYVIRALNLLKDNGIHISLDDFGTGHSSLTRLRDYPVDCIKIDRNFVENIDHDPSALAIIKAITQIGSSISLDILVEGIENNQQLATLQACDCQTGQGFYFYRPMPSKDAEQLLELR